MAMTVSVETEVYEEVKRVAELYLGIATQFFVADKAGIGQ